MSAHDHGRHLCRRGGDPARGVAPAARLGAILVLFLLVLALASPAAQDYRFYGNLELGAAFLHTGPIWSEWLVSTETTFQANHTVLYSWGEAAVRHRFFVTDSPDYSTDETGLLHHELHHAAIVMWPRDDLTVQFGRHSLPWGMGVAFFPADALHRERSRTGDDRGFDGVSAAWTASSDVTFSTAARLDTAVGVSDDPLRDVRWAGLLSGYLGSLEVAAGTVYQPGAVLRPSLGLSFPLGEVIVHGEIAYEEIGKAVEPVWNTDGPGDQDQLYAIPVGPGSGARGWAGTGGAHYTFVSGIHTVTVALEYLYTELIPSGLPVAFGHQYLYPIITWNGDRRWQVDFSSLVDLDERWALTRLQAARHVSDSLTLKGEGIVLLKDELRGGSLDGAFRLAVRVYF